MTYKIYLNNTIKQQQQESVELKKIKDESFKKQGIYICTSFVTQSPELP